MKRKQSRFEKAFAETIKRNLKEKEAIERKEAKKAEQNKSDEKRGEMTRKNELTRKEIAEASGLTWLGDFFESLPEDQKKAGYIKFNIPCTDDIKSFSGEGVWGWVDPESKLKYDDNGYGGKLDERRTDDEIAFCKRSVRTCHKGV